MQSTDWAKAYYLDASALVRLIADDPDDAPGRDILRKYCREHPSKLATSHCVSEALSVFKWKSLHKKISQNQYLKCVQDFIRTVIGGALEIDEVPLLSPTLFTEAERLIKKHNIDFIDCLQIVTILHGRYSVLGPNSKSILITADHKLALAARAEGAKVWEFTCEAVP
jgi:predicted nucleic acid-binding protein